MYINRIQADIVKYQSERKIKRNDFSHTHCFQTHVICISGVTREGHARALGKTDLGDFFG